MNTTAFQRSCILIALANAICMGVGQAYAQQIEETPVRFYDRKSEGWFWYAPEPEDDEEEPPKPPPKPQVAPTQSPPAKPASVPPAVEKGPAPFSAAWVRENLPKYKDAAWDNPTVENVRAFMYLQRFAIDRSEQFSNATEMAVLGDPYLDEISRRPAATFASQKLDVEAGKEKSALIDSIAQRAGIFFFFKDDEYSNLQASIVKMLEAQGFTIVPISVTGRPLKDNIFPNFKTDSGHAKTLNIVNFPATFLVSPSGKFEPIGQGALSLPEMKHRIIIAAQRNGWVSEEEYKKTKPIYTTDNNIAEKLDPSIFGKDLERIQQKTNGISNFVEPSKLMEYIRTRLNTK